MRRFPSLFALVCFALPSLFAEDATELAERFAVADDREAVVAALVPGTEEHFYYRCLLWQHQGKLAEVDALLPRWEALHPHSSRAGRIRLRQAVLWVDREVAVGAPRLAHEVGVDLALKQVVPPTDDPAPVDGPQLPSTLDPQVFAWDALVAHAEDGGRLDGWSEAGLERRLGDMKRDDLRRASLQRISDPLLPGLVEALVADLAAPGGDFGALPVHEQLTIAQLDALRAARPQLVEDVDYLVAAIRARLSQFPPGALTRDAVLRRAWISELTAFVAPLPAMAEPLQAFVALHHLAERMTVGAVAVSDVIAVVSRPLTDGLARSEPQASVGNNDTASGDTAGQANKSGSGKTSASTPTLTPAARLIQATGLSPVSRAMGLVDEALITVLAAADDSAAFAGLVEEKRLRQRFIEAKLLHGVGDASAWLTRPEDAPFAMTVQERVELSFGRSLPSRFAGDAPVTLPVVLKHVPELRVRSFALDPDNLYRAGHSATIDLDLAGVVPTTERTLRFAHPPIRRHHAEVALPECAGPGWWLIELIGGGQVARVVLHKGALSLRKLTRVDGEHLEVFDENDRPLRDAMVRIGDQVFSAGPEGTIRLPFVSEKRQDRALVLAAGRAAITTIVRQREDWTFEPDALLEREQLIAGGQATLVMRPRLRLNDVVMPITHLRDVQVEITTITRAGARRPTLHRPVTEPQNGEWHLTFPCDEGLTEVETTLRGIVRNRSQGEDLLLMDSLHQQVARAVPVGGLFDLHLEQGTAGWSLACLGRAGEPLAGEPLALSLQHRFLNRPLTVRLATDVNGRVHLGMLPDIDSLRAEPERLRTLAGLPQTGRRWSLHGERRARADLTIHAGQELRLPAVWRQAAGGNRDWSMVRGWGAAVEDVSNALTLSDEHGVPLLVAKALPAGRYHIRTPIGSTLVTVVAGARLDDVVLNADGIHAIGSPVVLGATVVPLDAGVRIQVVGRTPGTRVQVFGLRFHPQTAPRLLEYLPDQMVWPRPWSSTQHHDGRRLDPELGYILARAQVPRLPGVMLERPGLLLNPWFDETFMAIGAGDGASGMFGARHGGGARRAFSNGGGMTLNDHGIPGLAVGDFLSGPGVVLANLVPDASDAVVVPGAQLGDARQVLVQVCDATQSVTVIAPLMRRELAIRERRLMQGLPPDQHLVVQRRGQVVPAGGTASVRQGIDNRSRLCTTVEDLLSLYLTLDGDAGLRGFFELARWSSLSEAERRRWYSAHACHEVHLFLWRKDRAFFDAVVRPYLANKLQPGFIDHWLLEQDLTPWLSPERHRRLNLCERILLARRLGGEAGAQELASVRAEFAELDDEQAELGGAIAALLVEPGEVAVGVRQRAEEEIELPPMKVLSLDGNQPAPINQMEMMIEQQDYRDHVPGRALIEQQWHRIPWYHDDAAQLFSPSAFWRDFAAWDGQGTFLTPTCLLASSLNECLVALAFSDLPLTAQPPVWTEVGGERQVAMATPALLLSEELVPQPLSAGDLVVHQRYYDQHTWRTNPKAAWPHEGVFMPGVPYVAVSVLLNPTPRVMTVAVLAQIPSGAVSLGELDRTLRAEVNLKPYEHLPLEHTFYFPRAGTFTQFPTHVRAGTTIVAAVVPTRCEVGEANRVARGDWPREPAAILARLETAERWEVDLDALSWRLGDAAFWRACVSVLERRRWYDEQVWSFSLLHRDTARMAVWLRNRRDLVERLGQSVVCRWLTIDPLVEGGVVHADISPLTNARVHRLPGRPAIVSEQLRTLWQNLVERLALEPALTPRSRLELTYALTLQDRLAEAAAQFARIDRATIAMRLQYDYLGAWLALGRGDLAAAARFAALGVDHPVQQWRLRFAEVQAQLDEIAGKPATREGALREARRQDLQAAVTPSFQARLLDASTVHITGTQLKTCTVRWHRLDLEPLFSRAPFATSSAARATQVRAASTQEVAFAADGTATVVFPQELRHQAIAVEISAAGQSQVLTSFADALDVRLAPGSGQLQVVHATTGKPLPATYVKVYVERGDRVVFHKDGYTDLRGRFDYASLGDGSVMGVKRIALFISHDEAGATVREVSPP